MGVREADGSVDLASSTVGGRRLLPVVGPM